MRSRPRKRTIRLTTIAGAVALAASAHGATAATAAVPHVVAPGETLWSIAAANNFTTRTVAAFNGLPEEAALVEGQTIQVPTVEEGAAALAAAGITPAPAAPAPVAAADPASLEAPASAPGMGHIPSAWGEMHLDPAAADSWNAMRGAALSGYGVDLQTGGPLSAHRTYEQQAYLYDLYLSGQGAPAAPPGTSAHEIGTAVDLADPVMRDVIDQIGPAYGWGKVEAPDEWWHVNYLGG